MVMNSNSKKDKPNKDLPKVEESASVYYSKTDLENEDSVSDVMSGLLEKLLEKGIKQCEAGQLIPHEQVMRDIKKRFNIS